MELVRSPKEKTGEEGIESGQNSCGLSPFGNSDSYVFFFLEESTSLVGMKNMFTNPEWVGAGCLKTRSRHFQTAHLKSCYTMAVISLKTMHVFFAAPNGCAQVAEQQQELQQQLSTQLANVESKLLAPPPREDPGDR